MPSKSSSPAYDMEDISSNSSVGPHVEVDAQEGILSGVPVQTGSTCSGFSSTTTLSEHDKELRVFPLALTSKLFFFFGCAMYLWLSIDNLQWAHDALTIPVSVLDADDDVTWRQFRMRQNSETEPSTTGSSAVTESTTSGTESSGNNGYTRSSSSTQEYTEEDELTWSQFRDKNGEDRTRRALRHNRRRKTQEGVNSFHAPWDDLPFSMQIAAATLGYDELSWNNGGTTFIDSIPWTSLTDEQRNAALTLGYTEYLWNMLRGFEQPGTTIPATFTVVTQQPINAVPTTNNDWGNYFWSELPEEIRTEAAKLGYDETVWNQGERTFADDLFWDELTSEQQYAASVLGYSRETWDVYLTSTTTSSTSSTSTGTYYSDIYRNPATSTTANKVTTNNSTTSTTSSSYTSSNSVTSPPNGTWRNVKWSDLPAEIKGGAIALGYTEELWTSGAPISASGYFWYQLSGAQQKAAATIFGFTETTWNASNRKWQTIAWSDLPSGIRSNAEVLGYDEAMWNSGADIDTQSYSWNDLSGQQQQAAFVVFGYTESTWGGSSFESEAVEVKNSGNGRGGGRGGADDDYVFSTEKGSEDVWVSKYQIVYFVASICFTVVGILDIIRERRPFHTLMVLAGFFGILASMWVETNLTTTNIFNCFSTHFFVFQGITVFFYRPHLRALLSGPFKNAVWMADLSFILGAVMKAILSYLYFKEGSRENLAIARTDSFSSLLFFFCAMIYIVTTLLIFLRNTKQRPYL